MILLLSFNTLFLLAQPPEEKAVPAADSVVRPAWMVQDTLPQRFQDTLPQQAQDTLRQRMQSTLPQRMQDSARVAEMRKDTVPMTAEPTEEMDHSPTKAIMYALALPGLGQAYNKKYYKIPIVYAALGGVGYLIYFNNKGYLQASNDYALDPTDINERYLRFWRRNLELSYIGLVAVYALQTIDAYVDAQLFYWDVSENLSLRLQPSMEPVMISPGLPANQYGVSCRITF